MPDEPRDVAFGLEEARESAGEVLWGINLYPAEFGTDGWLEFDSMINLRPGQGNRTRSIDDPATRSRIARIVDRLVVP